MPAVLFDFDFTLADSSPGIIDAFGHALAAASLPPVPEAAVRATIGLPIPRMLECTTGVTDPDVARTVFDAFMARADETMEALTSIFEATRPTLEALRARGYETGIVSTKFRRRINAVLARHGLAELVGVVIGLDDAGVPKPDPAGLRLAMERLGTLSGETVYVGDHAVDAEAAHAAGVGFIGVLTGETDPAAFARFPALAIVPDIGHVPEVLGLGARGLKPAR